MNTIVMNARGTGTSRDSIAEARFFESQYGRWRASYRKFTRSVSRSVNEEQSFLNKFQPSIAICILQTNVYTVTSQFVM